MNTKMLIEIGSDSFQKIFEMNLPAYTYLYCHKYSHNNNTDNFIQNMDENIIYEHFYQEFLNGMKWLNKHQMPINPFGKVMFPDPCGCESLHAAKSYSNFIILGFGKIKTKKHDLSIFNRELKEDIKKENEKIASYKNCFYGIKLKNYKDRILVSQKFVHRYSDSYISKYSTVIKNSNVLKINPIFFLKNKVNFLNREQYIDEIGILYTNKTSKILNYYKNNHNFFKSLLTCRPF